MGPGRLGIPWFSAIQNETPSALLYSPFILYFSYNVCLLRCIDYSYIVCSLRCIDQKGDIVARCQAREVPSHVHDSHSVLRETDHVWIGICSTLIFYMLDSTF